MTGLFVRALIDGRWESVEVEELGKEDLATWVASLDSVDARRWVTALVEWIRDRVRELLGRLSESSN